MFSVAESILLLTGTCINLRRTLNFLVNQGKREAVFITGLAYFNEAGNTSKIMNALEIAVMWNYIKKRLEVEHAVIETGGLYLKGLQECFIMVFEIIQKNLLLLNVCVR